MTYDEYFYRMCDRKFAFRRRKSALNALGKIRKSGRIVSSNLLPYKCPFCQSWHLGHSKEV